MKIPLFEDIKNDRLWWRNILRIALFLFFLLALDFLVSVFLLKGVERNYGLKSDADVLMIGHSHLMLAIDKEMLEDRTGLKVAKYTREGVNMADRRVMVEQYYRTCTAKPETVILSIDPWLFTGEDLSRNSYTLFFPFIDNREVREYIKSSASSSTEYLKVRWIRSSRYNATLLNASIRGWLHNWDNLKTGVIDSAMIMARLSEGAFRQITFNRDLMNDFSSTLKLLSDKEARIVLVNTPVWQPVISDQQEKYDRAFHLIDSIVQRDCPSAVIIDMVPDFSGRTELFYDPIHMNPEGQREVTDALADFLFEKGEGMRSEE